MRYGEASKAYLDAVSRMRSTDRTVSALDFWEAYVESTNARNVMRSLKHKSDLDHSPRNVNVSPTSTLSALPALDVSPRPAAVAHAASPNMRNGRARPAVADDRASLDLKDIREELAQAFGGTRSRVQPQVTPRQARPIDAVVKGRFKDMLAALRYIDVEATGTLPRPDIERALGLWGVVGPEGADASIEALLDACRVDGDRDEIEYSLLVDALRRDKHVEALSRHGPGLASGKKAPTAAKVAAPRDPLQMVLAKLRPGVTPQEVRQAHATIRQKLTDKFTTVARAFRTYDTSHNGYISRAEFEFMLLDLNLDGLRHPVVESLIDIVDSHDDTSDEYTSKLEHDIQFREFARVFTATDLLSEVARSVRVLQGGAAPPEAHPEAGSFFAGGSAGMAGDRQLWAQGFGAREASIAYPAHARYAPLSEGD